MKNRYLTILLLSLFFMLTAEPSTLVKGQQMNVNTRVDSHSILIGSPFQYHIQVKHGAKTQVQWPAFQDTLGAFEILEKGEIDSSSGKNGIVEEQSLTITSFQPGLKTVPAQRFTYQQKGDTATKALATDTFQVKVQTVAVDTSESIKPVKGIYDFPLTFSEIWPYIAIGLGVILLIILGIWLYKRWQRKPQQTIKQQPTKHPHEIAIEKLEDLNNQRLWQEGYVKEYHDQLTDIVREYLEGVYQIQALELTTSEIMNQLAEKPLAQHQKDQLRKIFNNADLAKFAKANPSPEANQEAIKIAFAFIRETKEPEEQPETSND